MRGHTVPSLPVIEELTRRGVQVEYHTLPAFRTLVEEAGADFVAYRLSREDLLTEPVDSAEHLARTLAATEELLPLLLAIRRLPDLVLFDASALWGGILARRLQRPCVASITTFAMTRPLLKMIGAPSPAAWSGPIFDRLNAEHAANLRDHLDLMAPVADLKLLYTSRAFQPGGRFLDASHLFLGPLLDRRRRDGDRVVPADTRPLAYVSAGTIFNGDHTLLRRISDVLVSRGWQVILSLGDAAAEQLQSWPEHVQVHAFVDQIGVLAHAKLFVTHGGMNSVSEALAHGVPMIVIPQAVDQHLVARQCANLGAAVVIERDDVSVERLTSALDRIERERASFETCAARVQQSFSDVVAVGDAVDQALTLIEREPNRV